MDAIVRGTEIEQVLIIVTMISIIIFEQDCQAGCPSLTLTFIALRLLLPFFLKNLKPARLLNSGDLLLDFIYFVLLCNFFLKVVNYVLALERIDAIASNVSLIFVFFNYAHA